MAFLTLPTARPAFWLGLCLVLVLAGCARETGEAGVKPIGVGFDPGDLYASPEARGGIVDVALTQIKGTNLDLGVTGFFSSAGAFTDPESDPFNSVLGFSYFFQPAIVAADEYQLVSPKGPDVDNACLVQINARGPLGSFRTVDVGGELTLTNGSSDPALRTEFALTRNPQDYPTNTSNVYIYYIGTASLLQSHPLLPDNWAFGQELSMHFDGALPPEGAPVASIPLPSSAADEQVGKEAGDPVVFSPDDLRGVFASNRTDDEDMERMEYNPSSQGLPDPRLNDGVIHVQWDPPTTTDAPSFVTISLKLLGEAETGENAPSGDYCVPAATLEGTKDADWLEDYNATKTDWCDVGYEPDLEVGNDEFGLDALAEDTCHDGLDNDADSLCDEGGCMAEDGTTWLLPDTKCSRHSSATASCGADSLCRPVGGSRDPDDHRGDLICRAPDSDPDGDGVAEFVVPADAVQALLSQVDTSTVAGAVLVVSRTSEELITVPLVRDQVGNSDDINPVRLRLAQVQFGRVNWE